MIDETTVMEAKRLGVLNCDQSKPLREAARRMVEEDVSALAVVDQEGNLAGIISRTDLLRALLEYSDWQNQPIRDYMNPQVVTVPPQTTLLEVAKLLLDKQIHRVVVVRKENGKEHPISVVSAADVVYHMVKDKNILAARSME
jgi:CBS domain-containing protein